MTLMPLLYLFPSHMELFGYCLMVQGSLFVEFSAVQVSRYDVGIGFLNLPGDETH